MDPFIAGAPLVIPLDPTPSAASCRVGNMGDEIFHRLRLLVTAHCEGTLHQSGFVSMMLQLDADLARPHGFIITASDTDDAWTLIALRIRGRSAPCAAFEFLPGSGQAREPKWWPPEAGPSR